MTGRQIRESYLNYFKTPPRNHAVIPAARIVPENDPTTLFTSSGMQPLVPYLKGQPHPMGTRVADSQPSFRAEDIDEVGDNRHTTFFEMLGNWSLGDYFKKEQLPWFFEFVTSVIGLDPNRLYVSVFGGDDTVPKDEDSVRIWQELFKTDKPAQPGEAGFDPAVKIYTYDAGKNWWSRAGGPEKMPVGEIGGPDSEMFFDFDPDNRLKLHEQSPYKDQPCHINCDCGRFMEIGNSVFMQYIKTDSGFEPLPKQNVDFGGGLERLTAASADHRDVFTTDLFEPIIRAVETASGQQYGGEYQTHMRIIADHFRAGVFMIGQGLEPGNKQQGYLLRRLLRRATLKLHQLGLSPKLSETVRQITEAVGTVYRDIYLNPEDESFSRIIDITITEATKFEKSLSRGLKEFGKHEVMTGKIAFDLLQTFGFPWELSLELATERGQSVNRDEFVEEFKKHQELSRSAAKGLFKGGLADHSDTIVKYHTATHLLHAALRQVLGSHVQQMGSNITAERLRFDFKHNDKVSPEQLMAVEQVVNQKIKENLPVYKTIEDKDAALQSGAMAFFRDKYPDKVSVYTIGKNPDSGWFSKELCGGPHVNSTADIGAVTIKKEEAVGSGVRRIYMTLKVS